MTLRSQLPVYSHSRHADAFRTKSLSYGRHFQALVVKDDDPLLHVVAVHHRAHKHLSVFKLSPSIAFSINRAYVQVRVLGRFCQHATRKSKRYGTETLKHKY